MNCLAQDVSHYFIQAHRGLFLHLIGCLVGMKTGTKQYFIGVNIPNACDSLLMHEKGFQLAAGG